MILFSQQGKFLIFDSDEKRVHETGTCPYWDRINMFIWLKIWLNFEVRTNVGLIKERWIKKRFLFCLVFFWIVHIGAEKEKAINDNLVEWANNTNLSEDL